MIILALLLFPAAMTPQAPATAERPQGDAEAPLTVHANDSKNTALFFPEPIRQGIVGSENFIFTYNMESPQHMGILKGAPGPESNLLVITMDGTIYSFVVRYSKEVERPTYFVAPESSIGTERALEAPKGEPGPTPSPLSVAATTPVELNPNDITVSQDYETVHFKKQPRDTSYLMYNKDRQEYIRKFCSNLIAINMKNQARGELSSAREGVRLSLVDLVYNYNELYMLLEVDNGNGVDYDINFLNVSVVNHRKGKRKSAQTLYKKPLVTYQLTSRISGRTARRIVYVFPKFSINREKKVIIELNEWGGERNVTLDVQKNFINNPKTI